MTALAMPAVTVRCCTWLLCCASEPGQADLVGRLGGEEFAIVLSDTSGASAEGIAERLRARVAETPAIFGDLSIPMTISIGLAIQAETDTTIEQVIRRADDALYRAKRSGRNRVVKDQRPEAA